MDKAKKNKRDLVHRIFSKAISIGSLTRPNCCSRCGDGSRVISGHHWNYDKPLEVEWVCYRCHFMIHEHENDAVSDGILDCNDLINEYGGILSAVVPIIRECSGKREGETDEEYLERCTKVGDGDDCDFIYLLWDGDDLELARYNRPEVEE